VQAVVDRFGPADLTARDFAGRLTGVTGELVRSAFGQNSTDVLMRASPVRYVSQGDSLFLILHGEKDRLVPPSQSRKLYEQLKARGVPTKLVMVKDAGHGFGQKSEPTKPNKREIERMIMGFFDQALSNPE
jgi:dipeptidyl aminopeptidase/acylaminoacyl peptidase